MYITKQVERDIKYSWTLALLDAIKHSSEYCELDNDEEVKQEHIDEFLNTIIAYRKQQMKELIKEDKEYFGYIREDFARFASYDGTECRTIYRVFFALRGYKSFRWVLASNNMDRRAAQFAVDNYDAIGY